MVSFRLGGPDGVSVAAAHWTMALERLGFSVRTVAGKGIADHIVDGLALDAPRPPARRELDAVLAASDLVIVENLCSLPLNPRATSVLAECLAGRPALLHHHDLPWERERFAEIRGWPPDDPAWMHVVISNHSREQLAARGVDAVTVYNGFALPDRGLRAATRRKLEIAADELLLLQPTRAIARKNVPAGVALAEACGATYWLTGPAEEGYGPELEPILQAARCPVRRRLPEGTRMADAYAAADAVVLPSTWEGFGSALIESALHRRPLAVSDFPVAREIASLGFRWFPADDAKPLLDWLAHPDQEILEQNCELARRNFGLDALTARLGTTLATAGWLPRGRHEVAEPRAEPRP